MKKILIIIGCVILLLVGIGLKIHMNGKENEKLINQRDTALQIKKAISGLEEIKFNKNGGEFSTTENDLGKWSIGAKVKLSKSGWYDIDASKDGVEIMGKGFPLKNMQGGTADTVNVIYSNGGSELIQ